MKNIKKIIFALVCLLLAPTFVHAASGSIKVSGASTVVTGNKVTVTVTLSSATAIGSWQMDLNYDKNYLQLVSSNAEGNGTRMVGYASNSNLKSKTYTFAFKALKSGTTRVSVSSYLAYDFQDMKEMNLTSGSKSIRVMTQAELEATYSKDNNLKSLSVEGYELDKAFDKGTLEYTINAPTGTTSVNIIATKNDSTASVSGAGEVEVTEGLNTIPIIVTAQNGSEKTYTLIVNVEDLNPIHVKVDNEEYTIVKNSTLLTAPSTFTETKQTIENIEVPAFINTTADITLVGLKDKDGKVALFTYENGKYSKYNELNLKHYLLIPVSFDKELNFTKTTITINDEKVEAYKYSDKSDFVIINAKSLEDGKTALYLYDTKNNTAIRYDEEFMNETNDTIKNYTYIIIAFAGALFLTFMIIMSLLHSLRKKQKKLDKFLKKQEAKIEATRKLNDVVAEVKKITEEEKKQKEKQEKSENKKELNEPTKENNREEKEEKKLSKKDIKELKRLEKRKSKEENKENTKIEETKKEDEVIVKEVQVSPTPDISKLTNDDEEEVYDLFAEDKKKKKKKK